MEKFSEFAYVRPNFVELKSKLKGLLKQFKTASTFEEAEEVYLAFDSESKKISTLSAIASIRHDINTADKFYEQEVMYLNKQVTLLMPLQKKEYKLLLMCKFRKQFEDKYGKVIFLNAEADSKLLSLKNIMPTIKEGNLSMQFSKLVASAKTEFMGKSCNFYGLLKYMQDPDREIRQEALRKWSNLYCSLSPQLDKLYSKLVQLRTKMAKRLGFSNYTDMAYLMRHRYDYTANDVKNFRKQVLNEITPLCQKLIEEQRVRLGVDKIHFYDESLIFADGNANPIGSTQELLDKTMEIYTALSPETQEFFKFMRSGELFDLETKPNKHMGGYCATLPEYLAPFIFSNFNGTGADVQVLTHEAGHCFNMYLSMRHNKLLSLVSSTSEVNEIHSMSMEMFTYPYWDKYFGDKADKARYAHLVESLYNMTYMCVVDEFQHEVYASPKQTAEQRMATWRRIERVYMPWRDYGDNAFLDKGGYWMQKQHIFLYPFYYIDYALARLGAYEFYGKSKTDKTVWNDYVNLCRAGGSKTYLDLLSYAHLSSPFAKDSVKKAIGYLQDDLVAPKE
ncbi:MAG: M3 family oligoendopeptidase [Clostridia bacterium]